MPNGEDIGYALGDPYYNTSVTQIVSHRTSATSENNIDDNTNHPNSHPWGVLFTILGTVLLDFDADACQSPARTYLLDVTVEGNIIVFINFNFQIYINLYFMCFSIFIV